jgi:hypothetical protein
MSLPGGINPRDITVGVSKEKVVGCHSCEANSYGDDKEKRVPEIMQIKLDGSSLVTEIHLCPLCTQRLAFECQEALFHLSGSPTPEEADADLH